MAKPKKVEGSLEFDQEAEQALREVAKGILHTVSELTANQMVDSTFKQKLSEVDSAANDMLKKLNQGAAIMPKDLENFTTAILKANDILAKAKTTEVFQNKEVQQFNKVTKGGVSVFPNPTPKAAEMKNKADKMENIGNKMQSNLNSIADNAIKVMEHTKPTKQKTSILKKFVEACKSFISAIKSLFSRKKNVNIVRNEAPTRQTMLNDPQRLKQKGVAGMGEEAAKKAKDREIKPKAPSVPPRRNRNP